MDNTDIMCQGDRLCQLSSYFASHWSTKAAGACYLARRVRYRRNAWTPRSRYMAKMCAVGSVNSEIIKGSDYATTPRIALNVFVKISKQSDFLVLLGGLGSEP